MRSIADRLRHAAAFEIIGLLLITPLGAWAFGRPALDIGAVAAASTAVAMVWNYAFNLAFDHAMVRLRGDTRKTLRLRVLHAVMFELGLTALLVPFIALFLGIPLIETLVLDLSMVAFYLVYAFAFNWAYDLAFPPR